jgi:hypothetical protein
MSVQIVLDLTEDFNADADVKIDTGGFDYAVVQIVSPTGAIAFQTTNDSGAVQSVSDGSAISATNFSSVQGLVLASQTYASSTIASAIVKFEGIGRYLQLSGSGVTATKLLVRLYKIH